MDKDEPIHAVYPNCYCAMCMRSETRKAYEREKNRQLAEMVDSIVMNNKPSIAP